MTEIGEREKYRRLIGAGMLGFGFLCLIWAELSNHAAVARFGKATAAVGIIIYFLGRIGKLLRKR